MKKKKTAKSKKVKKSAAAAKKVAAERRRLKRWNVAVLVRCTMPQVSSDTLELEMWAKDVNSKGLKLEWGQGLSAIKVPKNSDADENGHSDVRHDDVKFAKGTRVMVHDLFYDDEGSPFMEGKISWARQSASTGNWGIGIQFTKSDKQTQDQISAFKDFIKIVQNPNLVIRNASRK